MSGEQIEDVRSALRAESRLHAETKIDLAEARLQIAALQAVIAHTLDHLDEQMETGLPLFPESIAVRLRRAGSVELDRVRREVAAQALDEAAAALVVDRVEGSTYSAGLPLVTAEWASAHTERWLRARAASIRSGATS